MARASPRRSAPQQAAAGPLPREPGGAGPVGAAPDPWLSFTVGFLAGLCVVLADRSPSDRRGESGASPEAAARSPLHMSARDWRAVLARAWAEFNGDHIPAVAAGATFFGLLALFPALGVFVSLYGLFADVETARLHVLGLRGVLPDGAISVLSEQMTRLAATPHTRLGLTFLISLVLSAWSANAGMKALIAGLNVAYEAKERRGFFRLNAVSLGFTLGGVVLAVLAAVVPAWLARIGWRDSLLAEVLRWPLFLASIAVILSLLYRYAPCRTRARWRWTTPGSVFAAFAWMAMSLLFSLYVANFGTYDKTYGSLGAIVGFMTWIWLSLTVVLLGAELNAELELGGSRPT